MNLIELHSLNVNWPTFSYDHSLPHIDLSIDHSLTPEPMGVKINPDHIVSIEKERVYLSKKIITSTRKVHGPKYFGLFGPRVVRQKWTEYENRVMDRVYVWYYTIKTINGETHHTCTDVEYEVRKREQLSKYGGRGNE